MTELRQAADEANKLLVEFVEVVTEAFPKIRHTLFRICRLTERSGFKEFQILDILFRPPFDEKERQAPAFRVGIGRRVALAEQLVPHDQLKQRVLSPLWGVATKVDQVEAVDLAGPSPSA